MQAPPKSRAQLASGGRPTLSATSSIHSIPPAIDVAIVKRVSAINMTDTVVYRCCVLFLLMLAVIAVAIAAGGVWNLSNRLQ